jgi:hypothetical protein
MKNIRQKGSHLAAKLQNGVSKFLHSEAAEEQYAGIPGVPDACADTTDLGPGHETANVPPYPHIGNFEHRGRPKIQNVTRKLSES